MESLILKCLNNQRIAYDEANKILSTSIIEFLEHIPYYFIDDVKNWARLQKQRNIYESPNLKKPISLSVGDVALIAEACGCEVEKQGRDLDYGSYEGKMSKSKLFHIARMSIELYDMLYDEDDLPGWVNDKITTAEDRISSAKKYIEYKLLKM